MLHELSVHALLQSAGERAIKRQRLKDGGGSQSVIGAASIIGGRSSSVIPGRSSSVIPGRSSSIIPGKGSVIPGRSTGIGGRTGGTTAGHQTSGMSSSLAFTPIQGIELTNPNAAREKGARDATDQSYFANWVGFKNTKKGGGKSSIIRG